MRIIFATKKYTKEISRLMLADLEKPNPKFPIKMISQFREHAKEENIIKELNNPNLIAFLAIKNNKLAGFIIGYKEDLNSTVIHYLTGEDTQIKKLLLKRFIDECKKRNITHIKTDTFEFMENNNLFKEEGFILTKKEKVADNLEMLWYERNTKSKSFF